MGPYIATSLFLGDRATPFRLALVDSGADVSVFPCKAARQMGLDPMEGEETPLHDFTGDRSRKKVGWIHNDVGLALKHRGNKTPAVAIRGTVVFTEEMELSGVLGRSDFFRQFRTTIDEEEQEIAMSLRPSVATVVDPASVPLYLYVHAIGNG